MKKYFYLLSLLFMTSCYEDYVTDNTFSGIYFTYQQDVRSFIVGEDMDFKVGAVLGGVLENNERRVVKFHLNDELVNDEALEALKSSKFNYIMDATKDVDKLKVMPSDWYSLSNNEEIVIEKGKHSGSITVSSVEDKILQDPDAYKAIYAIPFEITSVDADSLIENKEYSVVCVKYECKIFGRYYHYGRWTTYDTNNLETESKSISYKVPMANETVTELTTNGPKSVWTSTMANTLPYRLKITLNDDNSLKLEPAGDGYTIETLPEGCRYNNPKLLQDREMYLNYKVKFDDGTYTVARDTLKFFERIHDGVSEWQDLNPENYE